MREILLNSTNLFPYSTFKNLAFRFDPEKVHNFSLKVFEKFPQIARVFEQDQLSERYQINLSSMSWRFPVGLAAGLDKNAQAIEFFSKLYFGALEVGTITPLSQQGNPKPRLFRYPEAQSLRNCMGFNNKGMVRAYKNILNSPRLCPLGINIGKNKTTPNHRAPEDYQKLYQKLAPLADYMVLNMSSPNTPGLRDLLEEKAMEDIFIALDEKRQVEDKPIFLKISPDMPLEQIDSMIRLGEKYRLAGLIATNTTIREDLGVGGVSGKWLAEKSSQIRQYCLQQTKNSGLEIIGVGGISSFADLMEFWRSGGKVVQIYTSFIYQGPQILQDIKQGIDDLLSQNQFSNVQELINNINHIEVGPYKR